MPSSTRAADGAAGVSCSIVRPAIRCARPTGERPALIDRLPKTAGRRFVAVSPMPGIDGGARTRDLGWRAGRESCSARFTRLPCEFTRARQGVVRPRSARGREERQDRPRVAHDRRELSAPARRSSKVRIAGIPSWCAARAARTSASCSSGRARWSSRVLRMSVGTLKLDKSLSRGQHRQLTEEEVAALLQAPPADA